MTDKRKAVKNLGGSKKKKKRKSVCDFVSSNGNSKPLGFMNARQVVYL